MGTRKFTIEISDESVAVIERLKLDDATMEEVIPQLLDLGILEALTSQVNPMSKLLDTIMSRRRGNDNPIAEMMANLFGGDDVKPSMSEPDPSAMFKMMRLDENGEPVEVDIADLPEEISAHIAEMEAAVKEGLRNGKSMHEIMDGLGATACSSMGEVMERASRPKTEIISDGNVIHFPTTKLS